jgi:hypothetical protein
MYTALVAASQTVAAFLRQRLESDANLGPFFNPALGGTMIVSLSNPQEMLENNLEGLSVWLYRVVRDEELLNAPAVRETGGMRMPPLPVRMHLLVTPLRTADVVNGPELEQVILGKVLHSLYDHACFRGADLQGDLAGTASEFHVRLEPMTLEDITRVWTALDAPYELSVSYELTLARIRSERVEQAGPVLTVDPRSGVIVTREAV